jgi:hypothetical protein
MVRRLVFLLVLVLASVGVAPPYRSTVLLKTETTDGRATGATAAGSARRRGRSRSS